MLSESPPSEGSSLKDSMDDLFAIKRTKRPSKKLKFLENFNEEAGPTPSDTNCFSSKTIELNLSLSAKKVETIGLGSLNSSQQIFKNNLQENNSSRLLKHFGEIEVTCPETVMTSRVMLRDEDRLLGPDGKVDKPSSFSAQKEYLFAMETLAKDDLEELTRLEQYPVETERNRRDSEQVLKSDVKEATPDSEFLLNSEVVNVNQFDPKEEERPETAPNEMDFKRDAPAPAGHNYTSTKGKEQVTPLVFGSKLKIAYSRATEANPFRMEDPKTERSEYQSEHSGQKARIEMIQNSMKNQNFIMSAGKGKAITTDAGDNESNLKNVSQEYEKWVMRNLEIGIESQNNLTMITEDYPESSRSGLTFNSRLKNQIETQADKSGLRTEGNIFFERRLPTDSIINLGTNDVHDSIFSIKIHSNQNNGLNSDYDHFYKNQKIEMNRSKDKNQSLASVGPSFMFKNMLSKSKEDKESFQSYMSLKGKYEPMQSKTSRRKGRKGEGDEPEGVGAKGVRRRSYPVKKMRSEWASDFKWENERVRVKNNTRECNDMREGGKMGSVRVNCNVFEKERQKKQGVGVQPKVNILRNKNLKNIRKNLKTLTSKPNKKNNYFHAKDKVKTGEKDPNLNKNSKIIKDSKSKRKIEKVPKSLSLTKIIQKKVKGSRKKKMMEYAEYIQKDKRYYDLLFRKNKHFKFFMTKNKVNKENTIANKTFEKKDFYSIKKGDTMNSMSQAKEHSKRKRLLLKKIKNNIKKPLFQKRSISTKKGSIKRVSEKRINSKKKFRKNFSQIKRFNPSKSRPNSKKYFNSRSSKHKVRGVHCPLGKIRCKSMNLVKGKVSQVRIKKVDQKNKMNQLANPLKSNVSSSHFRKRNFKLSPRFCLLPNSKSLTSNFSNKINDIGLQSQSIQSSQVYLNKDNIRFANHINNLSQADRSRLLLLRRIQKCLLQTISKPKPRQPPREAPERTPRPSDPVTTSGTFLVDQEYVDLWNREISFQEMTEILFNLGYVNARHIYSAHYYETKPKRTTEEKLIVQTFRILDGHPRQAKICLKLFASFLMALDDFVLGFPKQSEFLGETRKCYRSYLVQVRPSGRSSRKRRLDLNGGRKAYFSNESNGIELIKSFVNNLPEDDQDFVLEEEKLILGSKPWIEEHLVRKIHSKFSRFRKNRDKLAKSSSNNLLALSRGSGVIGWEIHSQVPREEFSSENTSLLCPRNRPRRANNASSILKREAVDCIAESNMSYLEKSLAKSFPSNPQKNRFFRLQIHFKKKRPENIFYSLSDNPDEVVEKYAKRYGLNAKKRQKLKNFLLKNIQKKR